MAIWLELELTAHPTRTKFHALTTKLNEDGWSDVYENTKKRVRKLC